MYSHRTETHAEHGRRQRARPQGPSEADPIQKVLVKNRHILPMTQNRQLSSSPFATSKGLTAPPTPPPENITPAANPLRLSNHLSVDGRVDISASSLSQSYLAERALFALTRVAIG
jgi:hypothetical protein